MKSSSKSLPVHSSMKQKTLVFSAVNAKYPHTNLAVRLLAAEAKKTGIYARFTEHTIHTPFETIASDILSCGADVAAFSCYIWNMAVIRRVINHLKMEKPDIVILLGGPEVSFDAEEQLEQFPDVDFVISGEGEKAVKDLSRFFMDELPLPACASLTYRDGADIISNPQSSDDAFLTAEFPYADLDSLNRRVIYYESTRGCPYACAFCLSGGKILYREKPLELVLRDIKRFIDSGVKIVKFVNRTFNADKKRAMDVIRFIMHHAGETCFHLELSPQLLDDELIDLLVSAKEGLFQVEIGIQSIHPPTLKAINRKGDFHQFAPKIKRIIASRRIHVHVDLIAGLPFEGINEFRQSFDDVFALYAHNLQLGFLKLLKGSQLRDQANELGIHYCDKPPYEVVETPDLSREGLGLLADVEYLLKRFYNSGLYPLSIRFLSEKSGSVFGFFLNLREFIISSKIDVKHAAEIGLTDILWKFTEINGWEHASDIILFEALKKRKRPHFPPHIFGQNRYDFKNAYLKSHADNAAQNTRTLPVLFRIDVFKYCETGVLDASPSVVLFDYSDFNGGVRISAGEMIPE